MDVAAGQIRLKRLRGRRTRWLIATVALAAFWISTAWWGGAWWSPGRRWAVGVEPCLLCGSYWPGGAKGAVYPPGGRGFYSQNEAGYPISLFPRPYLANNSGVVGVGIPIWVLVAGAGAMLLYTERRARRFARELGRSLCPKCGYDLTGLGGGGDDALTCPECGNAAPLPAKK